MSLRGKFAIFLLACLGVSAAEPLLGQSQTSGRISGTIRDMQGEAIPRVEVLAVAAANGEKQRSLSNDSGNYILLALPPGNYDLTVAAPGFATSVFRSIAVGVGDTITINAVLQVASNTTEITVNDAPPLVQMDSSELGATLDTGVLTSLPLAARNSLQLIAVTPGANTALANNSAMGRNSPQVSVNGARVNQNSYQINGADANNIYMHDLGDVAVPAPESISEVKVQSSLYDASVSGAGGSSIELVTKDGTNSVHGAVYGYFRNEALNANDPNLKAVGVGRPILQQSVYGASVGGPVRKDRIFYFASYQGMRATNGATFDSLYTNVMVDPCLGNDRSSTTLTRNCSVSAIDPISLALLNSKLPNGQYLIPTPQMNGLVSGTAPSTYHEEQFNANLDFRLGANDMLTGKVFFAQAPWFSALGLSQFSGGPSFPGFGTHINVTNFLLSVRESHSLGPSTVNEARFGYNYIYRNEVPDEPIRDSDVGITRISAAEFPGLPLIVLARDQGGAAIGSNELTLRNAAPSFSFIDLLSLQREKHNIRFGGQVRHMIWRLDSVNAASYGEIDFATFQDFLTGSTDFSYLGTGQSQADFHGTDYHFFIQDDWKVSRKLTFNLGLRYELNLPPYETEGHIGGFDPGLYEPPTQVDENGFPLGPPAEGIIMAGNASSQIHLAGVTRVGKRIFKSVDPYDFGPRAGLAWSPLNSGRLAVRAGYGIFYSRPSFLYLGLNFAVPPFYQASIFSGEPFANPFPGAPPSSTFPQVQTGVALGTPWAFVDRNNLNPYFQQFNASVQYEILRDTVLQVAYVGSRGLRLYRQANINQARIASLDHPITNSVTGEVITLNTNDNAPLRAPLQGVDPGGFTLNESSGQSTYHSVQATLNRRFSHGLQFAAAYTYSKSMDNTSGVGGGAGSDGSVDRGNAIDTSSLIGNQVDPRSNRGLSDFDRPQRFTFTFVWDLPAPKASTASHAERIFATGWQLSGLLTAMSGLPIDIFDPAGGSLYGQFYGRPSWAPDANRNTAMNHPPAGYYFNPYAFTQALVQPGAVVPSARDATALAGDFGTDYGNLGRNILRGPSQSNVDLSVMKSFPIREGRYVECRVDFFNALNHPNKRNPVSDISAANLNPLTGKIIDPQNFGRILGTDSSPRILQLSLKFNF